MNLVRSCIIYINGQTVKHAKNNVNRSKQDKRHRYLSAIAVMTFAFGALFVRGQSDPPQASETSAGSNLLIPSGQKFILQLETALHTRTTRKGDKVEFSTAADIVVDNQVAIPNKSRVRATVTKAKRAGRLFGRAELHLHFDEVLLADGTAAPLPATITRVGFDPVAPSDGEDPGLKGESGSGGDIGAVAKGGIQGGIIGIMSAGPKGGLYGSAAGAAITAAGMILKRGPDLDLPRDTMFEAQFDQTLEIPLPAVHLVAKTTREITPSQTPAAVAAVDDKTSPPRPRLVRPDRGEPPATSGPPESRPPEPPPAAAPKNPPPVSGETQPAAGGEFTLSVSVRMVQVDAVVRDKTGRMIEDLTRDDFLVFEDGVQQEVQSFSRDELPLAVALVIDRSGSVAPYISELRRIAERALQQLKPDDQVALFSFAGSVERLEDLTTDRQRIVRGLARVRGGGGTNIIDALFDSVTYLSRAAPEYRHAIILISDNQATVTPQASEAGTIRKAMESDTVIYSIKTSGETPPLSMQLPSILLRSGSVSKVTRETGGEIIDARNVASLDSALSAVIFRLRMRYSLGYYPSNPVQGAYHSIVVRLADRLGKQGSDYFIHARRGYYSTADRRIP